MTLKRPEETFVRTTTELTQLWSDLMGDGGFSCRSVWMVFLAPSGELRAPVVPIDDLPPLPDKLLLGNLAAIAHGVLDEGVRSVAFLLSRPGARRMSDVDRHWARELRHALGDELCRWPVHLATRGWVQVFAPDDLVAA